jgi:ATP-binding cassette subfamily B protein
VISRLSFTATPGTTTAVIGSTGSGKSTLVNLVPRLLDRSAGSIAVGGFDSHALTLESLRSAIGLVPQRAYLFSGTVASNLRVGKPDASEDELWRALEIAQAADFVREMSGGLEAAIDQGGSNVSGGQRQRLCIARAVVSGPSIYLFDDSFSALDYSTDARLRAALRPVTRNATVLLVAQRVNTIIGADTILVLDEGKLVGSGTHEELLAGCPTYQEIVTSQLSESDEEHAV